MTYNNTGLFETYKILKDHLNVKIFHIFED